MDIGEKLNIIGKIVDEAWCNIFPDGIKTLEERRSARILIEHRRPGLLSKSEIEKWIHSGG